MPKLTCAKYPSLKIVKGTTKVVFTDGVAEVTAAELRAIGGSIERNGIVVEADAPAEKPAPKAKAADKQPEAATDATTTANPSSDLL